MATMITPAPVSVVIPCYRCAETIERALMSIALQTQPPSEVLLVEDASDDEGATMQAIERAANRLRQVCPVTIQQHARNEGPSAARNHAWEQATQPYLAFLDADDAWHPLKLERQTAWMLAHPEVALCGHASRIISSDALYLQMETLWAESMVKPHSMLWSNPFVTRGVMLKRTLPFRFPEEMRRGEDYYLWLSIAFAGHRIYRIMSVLAFSFKPAYGAGGLTGALWLMERGELAAYEMLRDSGHIGFVMETAAKVWSLSRFARRVLIKQLGRK